MPAAIPSRNPFGGSKPPIPRIATADELRRQIQSNLPGLCVYNPQGEWKQLEVFGLTNIWAPPDLGGAIEGHPITGVPTVCNGMLEIKGRFLTQKDNSGKVIEGQDAASMITYLVGEGQYGKEGIVFIPPGASEEQAETIKEQGRNLWLNFQQQTDDDIVDRRAKFKANWEKNPAHKGQSCPPPSEKETLAIERQQQRHRVRAFVYQCEVPECPGFAVNEWARFANHMKLAHQIDAKRSQYEDQGAAAGLGTIEQASKAMAAAAAPASEDDDMPPPAPERTKRPYHRRNQA